VGWRQVIEEMRQVASTQEWFREKGRHRIYAGDRPVPMPEALKRRLPVTAVDAGNGNGHGNPRGPGDGTHAEPGCGTACGCH
jgi:hypothetical protein